MTDDKVSETQMPDDIANLSFEQAMQELEGIVRQLEGEQATLEQAIESYSRGTQLKRHCEAKLAEARARVERITLGPDGEPGTAPFDPE